MSKWALVERQSGDIMGNIIAIFDTEAEAIEARLEEVDFARQLGHNVRYIVKPVNLEAL